MELRLSGTQEECADLAAVLPDLLGHVAEIERVSRFYPDHPDSRDGRDGPGLCGRVYVRLTARTDAPTTRRGPRPVARPTARTTTAVRPSGRWPNRSH